MTPPEPPRYIPEPVVRFVVDSLPEELREKARAHLRKQGFPLDDEDLPSSRPTRRPPPALESQKPKRRERR